MLYNNWTRVVSYAPSLKNSTSFEFLSEAFLLSTQKFITRIKLFFFIFVLQTKVRSTPFWNDLFGLTIKLKP